MNNEYVPTTQVRGWIRSLCNQNTAALTQLVQLMRVTRERALAEHIRPHIDRSETDRDRDNASNFYHRAFYKFAKDEIAGGRVITAFHVPGHGRILGAEPWMANPKSTQGKDWTGYTFAHVFAHLNEADLCIRTPEDPAFSGRGTPAMDLKRREQHKRQTALVGAQWLWPKKNLPTLQTLLPYAHLPEGYKLSEPIIGLQCKSLRDTYDSLIRTARDARSVRYLEYARENAPRGPYAKRANILSDFRERTDTSDPDTTIESGLKAAWRAAGQPTTMKEVRALKEEVGT